MLIRLNKSFYNWANLIFLLLNLPQYLSFIKILSINILNMSTWRFYKKLFIHNVGILINNLHKSYEYWLIKQTLTFFKTSSLDYIKVHTTGKGLTSYQYTKNIKLINFAFKKKLLNKTVISILYHLLTIWGGYTNQINITYSFIHITNLHYFMIAYNLYYFKVYNY